MFIMLIWYIILTNKSSCHYDMTSLRVTNILCVFWFFFQQKLQASPGKRKLFIPLSHCLA